MKVHVWTTGPRDMGALGSTVRVDETIELVTSDKPRIEITLDNGVTIEIEPAGDDTVTVTRGGSNYGLYISPRYSNQFLVKVPGPAD